MSKSERRQDAIDETKRIVFARYGGRCYYCGGRGWQLAHIVPKDKRYVERYGERVIHHWSNFRLTCDRCNYKAEVDPKTRPIEAAEHIARILLLLEAEDE